MSENRSQPRVVLIALYDYDFGVRSISAFLKSRGISTVVVSFKRHRYNREMFSNDCFTAGYPRAERFLEEDMRALVRLLEKIKPDIVGVSLTSVTYQIALQMTRAIKASRDVFVVWGGIHPTLCPEECIEHADAVCVGEGEYPVWELCERRTTKEPIDTIQNLWVRVPGGIRKNEVRPLISDLDSLPFPDFLDGADKYLIEGGQVIHHPAVTNVFAQGVYPIMASRGCLFECSFCCNSVFKEQLKGKGTYFRRRSVEHVIQELSDAVRRGPFFTVRFWDDVFTFDRQWIEKFCHEYRRRIGKPFACYAHPQHLHKDVLDALLRAGVAHINIGIQSGSERVSVSYHNRDHMNKQLIAAAEYLKASRVSITYDLIVDNPFETEKDNASTVEVLLSLPKPYQVFIYSLCYFPKTPLTRRALLEKIIEKEDQEQFTSKALNNFYVYIPFAKDKFFYFWDCLIAMACNSYFPARLVRRMTRSSVLQRYPGIIYALGRKYLGLIRIVRGLVNRFYAKQNWMINTIPDAALYYYGFIDKRCLLSNRKTPLTFFARLPVELSMYLLETKGGPSIGCDLYSARPESFEGDIYYHLYEAYAPYSVVARWRHRKTIVSGNNPFTLSFSYPDLLINEGRSEDTANLVFQRTAPGIAFERTYVLNATTRVRADQSFIVGNRVLLNMRAKTER